MEIRDIKLTGEKILFSVKSYKRGEIIFYPKFVC